MLKTDFNTNVSDWKFELKNRIQTIFENAFTLQEHISLLNDWHRLHDEYSISDVLDITPMSALYLVAFYLPILTSSNPS